MLYYNQNPIELKDEINTLTKYVLEKWNNASLLSSEKETESSDVSFISKELIAITWAVFNKNLKLLLKELKMNYSVRVEEKKIFISYRREGGSLFAQFIHDQLEESRYNKQVFLDVYDMQYDCSEFDPILERAIDNAKVVIAVVSNDAFDRACTENYDNQNDVYYRELSKALDENKHIITVYTNQRPVLPEKLSINKEFYDIACRLSKKNAVFYNPGIPRAMEKLVEVITNKINRLDI